ncbi:hypothetical protein SESBI_44023 [Sesbania bispinosa]|nr:hypothetical protein SESBI_44023 [Sesbania bispinosa]
MLELQQMKVINYNMSDEMECIKKEHEHMKDQLHSEIQESYESEAFIKIFGKEHPGYVRGMRLGVTSTQIVGSCSSSSRTASSSEVAKIAQMQSEIDTLKAHVAEVDVLKEQLTFLMQAVKGNQAVDLESPTNLRRSSESSHVPANDNGGSSPQTI